MQDGPQGFRAMDQSGGAGTSTAWPSAMTIASSWDEDLLHRWSVAMAEEFRGKGADMALAPGIGIARVPTAGRNFEYLCGEDPVLGSKLVKNVVQGLQENGVIANAKHFINNEIETRRMLVSAEVNERVRFELYYPPFEAAAEAGVLSVMCSYNRVNDIYACQNNETLSHLRDNLGFQGWVISDWTATKSTSKSLKAGMDMEMPYGIFYSNRLLNKNLESGDISESDIDNSVLRVLTAMYSIGMFDRQPFGDPKANVTSDAHNALAREIAAKSTVLLKNDNSALPLQADQLGDCVAVFGDENTIAGGGSGAVKPAYVITPQMGISAVLAGTKTQIIYNSGSDLSAAADLAKKCSASIVVVSTNSCEGSDRENLSLGDSNNNLVTAVAAASSKTIVDIRAPGAVLMPWASQVSAILVSWMSGQEAGNALADILFGKVNPSARLPVTMPNKDNEVEFTQYQYPGVGFPPKAHYTEDLLIGYRWYDAKEVEPAFSFGHGLSYSTYAYNKIIVTPQKLPEQVTPNTVVATVAVTVTNSGPMDGAEIPQLYIGFPKIAMEPPRQLRNFAKVDLKVNEQKTVQFPVTAKDCSIWDSSSHSWKLIQGKFGVFVGASSRDIRLTSDLTIA
jgi:beta-glucosidase